MDFTRSSQQQTTGHAPASAPSSHTSSSRKNVIPGWLRVSSFILLISTATLAVAAIVFLAMGGGPNEDKYLDKNKLQAVFLNNGQIYFGKISTLNEKFARMTQIYYLRQNPVVQPEGKQQQNQSTLELVKLGCEVHGPDDEMIISREQISYWENLKNDSLMAQKVNEFAKNNPNGLECKQADTSQDSN